MVSAFATPDSSCGLRVERLAANTGHRGDSAPWTRASSRDV